VTGVAEFCPRCGVARTGALKFCRGCGFDFESGAGFAAVPPSAPAPAAPPVTQAKRSRSGFWVLLFVIGLALWGWSRIYSGGTESPSAPRSATTARPAGISPINLSGSGSTNWGPAEFPGGLYSVAWEANGMCAFSIWIETTDASDRELAVNSAIFDETGKGTETARLDGGRYLVSVGADGCNWAMRISSIQ